MELGLPCLEQGFLCRGELLSRNSCKRTRNEESFVSKSWKRAPLRPDQLGSELGQPSKIDLWLNQGVVHSCTISTSVKNTFCIFMARLLFWENVSSLWQANISGDFPNEMTEFPPLYFCEPCDFAPNQPQTRNQNTC